MSIATHGLNSRADRPAATGTRSWTVTFGMMPRVPDMLNQICSVWIAHRVGRGPAADEITERPTMHCALPQTLA